MLHLLGVFSRKAFERLGFTVAAEFPYSEYELDGIKVFPEMERHKCVTLLTKRLLPIQNSIDEVSENPSEEAGQYQSSQET